MHAGRVFFRWIASPLLVVAAFAAVVVWLLVNVLLGAIVPRGGMPDFGAALLLRVLPIVLVGSGVYLLSHSFYTRDIRDGESIGWRTHVRHSWLLYALMVGAVYGLRECFSPMCHPDAGMIHLALGLGAMGGIVADVLALRRNKRPHRIAAA